MPGASCRVCETTTVSMPGCRGSSSTLPDPRSGESAGLGSAGLSVDQDGTDERPAPVSYPAQPAEAETFSDRDAIQRAFTRLDGATRALLVVHYVDGAPLAEVARVTNSPVGTVKWRLSRARKALERALEAERR